MFDNTKYPEAFGDSKEVSDGFVHSEDLAGQVIAITQAETGYGRSIALALSRRSATVALFGNNSEMTAQLASFIESTGGSAIPIRVDATSSSDHATAQEKVIELYGHLDGVVHLANQESAASFGFLTMSEWVDLLNINVRSTLAILHAIHRQTPQTWLTVIGTSDAQKLHLQAIRGALEGLTRSARLEDVRCNLLLPNRISGGEMYDQELCEMVALLANPKLSHIGGNVIEVPLPNLPGLHGEGLAIDPLPEEDCE